MDEDAINFAHGLTSAVAATSVWEVLRTLLSGWVLLMVGALASGFIFHLVHLHHRRLLRLRQSSPVSGPRARRPHRPTRQGKTGGGSQVPNR